MIIELMQEFTEKEKEASCRRISEVDVDSSEDIVVSLNYVRWLEEELLKERKNN